MELPPTWFMLISSSVFGLIARSQAIKHGRNPRLWFWIGFLMGGLGIFTFFLTKPNKQQVTSSKKAPPPTPQLQDGAWYYSNNQEQNGPYSAEYMKKVFEEGVIHANTLVWHESLTNWVKLETFIK